MPSTRSVTAKTGDEVSRSSHPGAVRPLVAASYRGRRQAAARTVKETTRAATAPAMASSGGMGRSFAPPSPWARTEPSTSADFELQHDHVGVVRLHLDH